MKKIIKTYAIISGLSLIPFIIFGLLGFALISDVYYNSAFHDPIYEHNLENTFLGFVALSLLLGGILGSINSLIFIIFPFTKFSIRTFNWNIQLRTFVWIIFSTTLILSIILLLYLLNVEK